MASFTSSYIPSNDTFTSRASVASYIGSNGLLQSAAINVARMQYNPLNLSLAPKLLLESASTNLLTYSEQFDNAAWTKTRTTVTPNATTAPDGTLTADKVVEDSTAAATHHISILGVSFTSGVTYSLSMYAKAAERTKFAFRTSGLAFTLINPVFDLVAVTATNGASITSIGNGWYRCAVTFTATSTALDNILFDLYDATGFLHNGDGVSGLYPWGAQLEASAYPTSYIQTVATALTRSADVSTSAAATRSADVASMTGTNFSSWYNQTEGTFVAKHDRIAMGGSGYPSALQVSDGTQNNAIGLLHNTSAGGRRYLAAYVSGVGLVNIDTLEPSIPAGAMLSTSFAYKLNDYAMSRNGETSQTDTSAAVPVVNKLDIGGRNNAVIAEINGHIANISYYPKRLTNLELQALSTQ